MTRGKSTFQYVDKSGKQEPFDMVGATWISWFSFFVLLVALGQTLGKLICPFGPSNVEAPTLEGSGSLGIGLLE